MPIEVSGTTPVLQQELDHPHATVVTDMELLISNHNIHRDTEERLLPQDLRFVAYLTINI